MLIRANKYRAILHLEGGVRHALSRTFKSFSVAKANAYAGLVVKSACEVIRIAFTHFLHCMAKGLEVITGLQIGGGDVDNLRVKILHALDPGDHIPIFQRDRLNDCLDNLLGNEPCLVHYDNLQTPAAGRVAGRTQTQASNIAILFGRLVQPGHAIVEIDDLGCLVGCSQFLCFKLCIDNRNGCELLHYFIEKQVCLLNGGAHHTNACARIQNCKGNRYGSHKPGLTVASVLNDMRFGCCADSTGNILLSIRQMQTHVLLEEDINMAAVVLKL